MRYKPCAPYRGFTIDIEVTADTVVSLEGYDRRYFVSWSILSSDGNSAPIASLPEKLDFFSPDAAFSYGESRAHAFIDGCLGRPCTEGEEI
ncbi:hypothetical protein C2L64_09645 [Paraburkholderia hospita]|uniref:Uncharacterized protein n=1 Tax=Paraburkholderia hospita TaxID=169430 RepID=A0AAN1JBH0_9BURK|nr:hypothetical protein C2L64_09645 [Paraburkholderia hospita]